MITAAQDESKTELWQKRLAHISEKGLAILANKKMISDIDCTQLKRCLHCLAGKQNKAKLNTCSLVRRPSILNLVHYGLYGPMKVK